MEDTQVKTGETAHSELIPTAIQMKVRSERETRRDLLFAIGTCWTVLVNTHETVSGWPTERVSYIDVPFSLSLSHRRRPIFLRLKQEREREVWPWIPRIVNRRPINWCEPFTRDAVDAGSKARKWIGNLITSKKYSLSLIQRHVNFRHRITFLVID